MLLVYMLASPPHLFDPPTPTPHAEADQVRPSFSKAEMEGLSELIELDEMVESVIWPHGLNAVKAKQLLQVKRDLEPPAHEHEDHDATDPEQETNNDVNHDPSRTPHPGRSNSSVGA